jgi:hypothetical protein
MAEEGHEAEPGCVGNTGAGEEALLEVRIRPGLPCCGGKSEPRIEEKGRSGSSAMDTGELGERPVHDADGELLVQELRGEEEGPNSSIPRKGGRSEVGGLARAGSEEDERSDNDPCFRGPSDWGGGTQFLQANLKSGPPSVRRWRALFTAKPPKSWNWGLNPERARDALTDQMCFFF